MNLLSEKSSKSMCRKESYRRKKKGRTIFYRRVSDLEIAPMADAIDFFTEVAPCGVIGSYLQDKLQQHDSLFTFKHHYITQTMDSDIMALLLKRCVKNAIFMQIISADERTNLRLFGWCH